MKIASTTNDHTNDMKIGCTSGKASLVCRLPLPNSTRLAATVAVTGFQVAMCCSHSGMPWMGTNALDRNVKGNSHTKPAVFAVSEFGTDRPIHAPIHVNE